VGRSGANRAKRLEVVHGYPSVPRALAHDFPKASNALACPGAVARQAVGARCQKRQQGASPTAVCHQAQSAETLEARLVFLRVQPEQDE
jgi:hypothetical protein